MESCAVLLCLMVCLLSVQEKISGNPATEADLKDFWAKKCEEELSSKNYCTQKLTGHGYPSVEELEKLYYDNIGKYDFRSPFHGQLSRVAHNICRAYSYFVRDITMIKDEHDNIRYTLYIPGVYEMYIPVQECKPHANYMLDRVYRKNYIKCVQTSFQYPFIVLSQDKKSLEFVKIKGLNSSCSPRNIKNKAGIE